MNTIRKSVYYPAIVLEMVKHVGHENVISADTLARIINPEHPMTNAAMRKDIHATIALDGIPVVSCNKGFYIATCSRDIAEYNRSMENRVNEILQGIEDINAAFANWHR